MRMLGSWHVESTYLGSFRPSGLGLEERRAQRHVADHADRVRAARDSRLHLRADVGGALVDGTTVKPTPAALVTMAPNTCALDGPSTFSTRKVPSEAVGLGAQRHGTEIGGEATFEVIAPGVVSSAVEPPLTAM